MQAVPRIFSTAADGKSEPREFLAEYFPNLERMAACIFLKGYQWPFDAQRIQDHQSSLVDLAVHRETVQRGRRVWMDFLRNPAGRPEWGRFSLERLEPEALTYLRRTGALQERPIERLAHMNPPAVEIYAENGIDLRREPLEIAVCAQHHNGGFVVNKWWESSLPHTFVIGEMAGTHGVKRPGGAALNSGQVGALRAAQFIAHVHGPSFPSSKASILRAVAAQARELLERLSGWLKSSSGARTPAEELEELTGRMTREGAHLRNCAAIARAVGEAREQQRRIAARGLRVARPSGLPEALHAESLALTQLAFLRAIEDLILARGGGSRGSHVVLDANGIPLPDCLRDPASGEVPRRRPENEDLRRVIQVLRYRPSAQDSFEISYAPVRPIPERDVAFEPAWTAYREQRIFQETDGA
jgi:succinate dehydrogenase/fumarate reductase flavoprotein subunit